MSQARKLGFEDFRGGADGKAGLRLYEEELSGGSGKLLLMVGPRWQWEGKGRCVNWLSNQVEHSP